MQQIITDTIPLVLIPLPSGAQAAVVYAVTLADIVHGLLLTTIVILQILAVWRQQRTA